MRAALVLSAVVLMLSSGALAQEPATPACAATDTALPSEWAGWTKAAPATTLSPGKAAAVQLQSSAAVKYVVAPEKPPAASTNGALLELNIDQSGRYALALGSTGWLDLVRDGKVAADVAHSHGPDCSSIRKIVEFDLTPGRYLVQISGAPVSQTRIMVVRR